MTPSTEAVMQELNAVKDQLEQITDQFADYASNMNKAIVKLSKDAAMQDDLARLIRTEYNLPTQRIKLYVQDRLVARMDGLFHEIFPDILKTVAAGLHVYIVGPAGSGKTLLASQVAAAMEIPFYATGALDSPYKLSGFMDAQSNYHRTAFRKAFEDGGLFLFDEVDASSPNALMFFNAALANDWCDFPDGMIKKHPQFICIACANTFGTGRDRLYVGRNQLDAATLDRFTMFEMNYDPHLERKLAGDDDWVHVVQVYRAAADKLNLRVVISPRASINGAKTLRAGFTYDQALERHVFKGMEDTVIARLRQKYNEILPTIPKYSEEGFDRRTEYYEEDDYGGSKKYPYQSDTALLTSDKSGGFALPKAFSDTESPF